MAARADYPHRVYVRNVEFMVTHAAVRTGLAKLGCSEGLQNIQVVRSGGYYPGKKCSLFLAYETEEACKDVVAKLDGQQIAGCTAVPASAEMAVPRMQRLPKMMQQQQHGARSAGIAAKVNEEDDGYDDGDAAAPPSRMPPWRQLRLKEQLEGHVAPRLSSGSSTKAEEHYYHDVDIVEKKEEEEEEKRSGRSGGRKEEKMRKKRRSRKRKRSVSSSSSSSATRKRSGGSGGRKEEKMRKKKRSRKRKRSVSSSSAFSATTTRSDVSVATILPAG